MYFETSLLKQLILLKLLETQLIGFYTYINLC